jgi:hypothetical protein
MRAAETTRMLSQTPSPLGAKPSSSDGEKSGGHSSAQRNMTQFLWLESPDRREDDKSSPRYQKCSKGVRRWKPIEIAEDRIAGCCPWYNREGGGA